MVEDGLVIPNGDLVGFTGLPGYSLVVDTPCEARYRARIEEVYGHGGATRQPAALIEPWCS